MNVERQETGFRAYCERCGDSFEIPFADLRLMLGGLIAFLVCAGGKPQLPLLTRQ